MLSKSKQYFYNPVCIHCGSFFVKAHLFCDICFSTQLAPHLELKIQNIDDRAKHAFLIDWVPGQSDLISEMVYRFKSDKAAMAWSYYSELFAYQFSELIDVSKFDAFVPLPGSSEDSVHATLFAKNLSQIFGLPVLNCLSKPRLGESQKVKTAKERNDQSTRTPIEKLEQFTYDDVANLKLIYVDDIMTTGATFKRSREALQSKNHSVLATLFFRPKAYQT
jgi:predicted amidophosphoribosyltransferase